MVSKSANPKRDEKTSSERPKVAKESGKSKIPDMASEKGFIDPESKPFIVGIGASAGGLEAIEEFFDNTPSGGNMAFVIIQHLSPEHKSIMGSLLEKHTQMKVIEVRDGLKIQPDYIYLNSPNKEVNVLNGVLYLAEPVKTRALRLPIDHFFRSLAEDQGEKAVCLILSGTGSDGSSRVSKP